MGGGGWGWRGGEGEGCRSRGGGRMDAGDNWRIEAGNDKRKRDTETKEAKRGGSGCLGTMLLVAHGPVLRGMGLGTETRSSAGGW